jgi:hypothetical protein
MYAIQSIQKNLWNYQSEKVPEKSLKIKDAGGNVLGYKGTYLVPMQVLGRKVMHDLVVLDNVKDQILGIDFIRQHIMSYNALKNVFGRHRQLIVEHAGTRKDFHRCPVIKKSQTQMC